MTQRKFLLVGLTGGIATGKSTVSQMFLRLGAVVIDADLLAREVVAPGELALAQIAADFGADVIQPDGTLDRRKLGAVIFGNAERRKRLEQITHPAIRERFVRRLAELEAQGFDGLVFWDAPVMIESGGDKDMDRLVVVATDEATQCTRLCARDGIETAEAERKIRSQMPVAEKAKLADYVIDNAGDRAVTEARVREVYEALLRDLASAASELLNTCYKSREASMEQDNRKKRVVLAPRIVADPGIKSGKPVIEGTRVPVDLILGQLAGGMSIEAVIDEYVVTREDVLAALAYAAQRIGEERIWATG